MSFLTSYDSRSNSQTYAAYLLRHDHLHPLLRVGAVLLALDGVGDDLLGDGVDELGDLLDLRHGVLPHLLHHVHLEGELGVVREVVVLGV